MHTTYSVLLAPGTPATLRSYYLCLAKTGTYFSLRQARALAAMVMWSRGTLHMFSGC